EFNSDIESFANKPELIRFGGEVKARSGETLPFEKKDSGNLYGVEIDGKIYAFPTTKGIMNTDVFFGRFDEVFGLNKTEVNKQGRNFYIKKPKVIKPAVFYKNFTLKTPGELDDVDSSLKLDTSESIKEKSPLPLEENIIKEPTKETIAQEAKEGQSELKEAPAGVSEGLWNEWLSFSQNEKGSMALARFLTDQMEELTKKGSLTSEKRKELKDLGVFLREKEQ
ncbi:hypothetical protein L6252_00390, partial [Candidatus Parcubacteria bacterium]|nr:hypothetical protein [Candidatus Parcubacteria bacterium]